MRVQQIQRTASVAWCHTQPLLASGTLVGTMSENFDPTGTLEIFDIDYKQGVTEPRVSVKTDEKLYKLAWSGDCSSLGDNLGLGLIAGGLENGVIGLWNPSLLLQYVLHTRLCFLTFIIEAAVNRCSPRKPSTMEQ